MNDPLTCACRSCGHFGIPQFNDATELVDDMHDRPPSRVAVMSLSCTECDSQDVRPAYACLNCGVRPIQVVGTDFCRQCYACEERESDAQAVHS